MLSTTASALHVTQADSPQLALIGPGSWTLSDTTAVMQVFWYHFHAAFPAEYWPLFGRCMDMEIFFCIMGLTAGIQHRERRFNSVSKVSGWIWTQWWLPSTGYLPFLLSSKLSHNSFPSYSLSCVVSVILLTVCFVHFTLTQRALT